MEAQKNRPGEWAALEAHLPDTAAKPIGVVLRDKHERLHVKLASNRWHSWAEADPEIEADPDISELVAADLQAKASEYRASELPAWLAQRSHAIRLSAVGNFRIRDAERDLNALYDKILGNKVDNQHILPSRNTSNESPQFGFFLRFSAMPPSFHWTATVAVATAVLCFTDINEERGTRQSPRRSYSLTAASMFNRLPGVLDERAMRYSQFFTNLEIQSPAPPVRTKAVRRRKILKPSKFRPPRLQAVLRRQIVQDLDPPATAVQPQPANVQLVALEPSPPAGYVPRRNRLLRSLAILGTSFKLLRSRRKSA